MNFHQGVTGQASHQVKSIDVLSVVAEEEPFLMQHGDEVMDKCWCIVTRPELLRKSVERLRMVREVFQIKNG